MSLGSQLKAQAAAREAAARQAELDNARAKEAERQARKANARAFFEKVKLEVQAAVTSNKPYRAVKIPNEFRVWGRDGGGVPSSDRNGDRYFADAEDVVAEFTRWANENDLEFRIGFDHDGVGMESWGTVLLAPR